MSIDINIYRKWLNKKFLSIYKKLNHLGIYLSICINSCIRWWGYNCLFLTLWYNIKILPLLVFYIRDTFYHKGKWIKLTSDIFLFMSYFSSMYINKYKGTRRDQLIYCLFMDINWYVKGRGHAQNRISYCTTSHLSRSRLNWRCCYLK
jgi:hypothetical protein